MVKLSEKEMMAVHGGDLESGLTNAANHEQSPVMDIVIRRFSASILVDGEIVHTFAL